MAHSAWLRKQFCSGQVHHHVMLSFRGQQRTMHHNFSKMGKEEPLKMCAPIAPEIVMIGFDCETSEPAGFADGTPVLVIYSSRLLQGYAWIVHTPETCHIQMKSYSNNCFLLYHHRSPWQAYGAPD